MQPSSKAILNLSASLYGYYDERHIAIRAEKGGKPCYPLFFNIGFIQDKKVSYEDSDKVEHEIAIHLEHKPTENNYWHFEFVVYDGNEHIILPETKPGSVPKLAAQRLLHYLTTTQGCLCRYENKQKYENKLFSDILKLNKII